jgi:hypothetical protein
MRSYDSAVASEVAAGAPETEIEVTPAMIEAGVGALCASNEDFEEKSDIVSAIYTAMAVAKAA